MQLLTYLAVVLCHLVIHYQCAPVSVTEGEQNLELYQGDMVLQPNDDDPRGKGVASRPAYQRWVGGVIPYEFSSNISANNTAFIVEQMRKMENLTMVNNISCIQFREKNATDQFFLTIVNGSGCYAPVGSWGNLVRVRGVSLMHSPTSTCMVSGIIQHELMHALGFYHEQSRPDRDSYVSIQWANINPGQVNNFEKYNDSDVDTQMTSYDYGSVMHYERNAFAINSSAPTIITIQNVTAYIGQRIGLSPVDVLEIQRYYGCVPTPTMTTTTNTVTTTTSAVAITTTTPVTTTSETTITTTSETTTTETTTESGAIRHAFSAPFQLFIAAFLPAIYLHSCSQ